MSNMLHLDLRWGCCICADLTTCMEMMAGETSLRFHKISWTQLGRIKSAWKELYTHHSSQILQATRVWMFSSEKLWTCMWIWFMDSHYQESKLDTKTSTLLSSGTSSLCVSICPFTAYWINFLSQIELNTCTCCERSCTESGTLRGAATDSIMVPSLVLRRFAFFCIICRVVRSLIFMSYQLQATWSGTFWLGHYSYGDTILSHMQHASVRLEIPKLAKLCQRLDLFLASFDAVFPV